MIAAFFISIIAAFLTSLILERAEEISQRIITKATNCLSLKERERRKEQYLADNENIKGRAWTLMHALGCMWLCRDAIVVSIRRTAKKRVLFLRKKKVAKANKKRTQEKFYGNPRPSPTDNWLHGEVPSYFTKGAVDSETGEEVEITDNSWRLTNRSEEIIVRRRGTTGAEVSIYRGNKVSKISQRPDDTARAIQMIEKKFAELDRK